MPDFLYEKDLRVMRYNILTSARHNGVATAVAGHYGLKKQEVLRMMMERMDMILLENLPARYDVWQATGDSGDEIGRKLGCELISRYVPLADRQVMDRICSDVKERIRKGTPKDEALSEGLQNIREILRT
jgi:energy-converting hydrogenase A subunit M